MATETSIAWADSVFNPWVGCTKISVGPLGGCEFCYALARDIRFAGGEHWGPGAPRRVTSASNWARVLTWNRQAADPDRHRLPRVMCGSLCDVFDNEVGPDIRLPLWRLIHDTRFLRWMLITKRVGNVPDMVPASWLAGHWPGHVGIIATMVNQGELDRDLPKLLRLPAPWWGISIEPQTGRVGVKAELARHAGAHPGRVWVIAGGESYQPMIHKSRADVRGYNLAWASMLAADCRDTGIAYFQKQMGASPYVAAYDADDRHRLTFDDANAGANPAEWPEHLRIRQFPAPLQ